MIGSLNDLDIGQLRLYKIRFLHQEIFTSSNSQFTYWCTASVGANTYELVSILSPLESRQKDERVR